MPFGVEHADGVRAGASVTADEHRHRILPTLWRAIPIAESLGGMFIHRRSGRQPTAHLPVGRLRLPTTTAALVSWLPSKGERSSLTPAIWNQRSSSLPADQRRVNIAE